MLHFLRDRRTAFLLVAVVASLFVLMAIQVRQGKGTAPDGLLLRAASPFLRAFSSVSDGVGGLWNDYVNLRGTRRRNTELQEEVTRLQMDLQKLQEAGLQNDRLRSLLDLKDGMGVPSRAASVIGNNSRGISRTLLLDRGSNDGIAPNMPVVSAQGVVGRVWTVTPMVSKIQLITDVDAGTAVLVQRTRVQGILVGRGSELCALEYVSMHDEVAKGDLLVTSGLDGIYPRGLPVGRVETVEPGRGILRSITVEPRVQFNRLEEVLVLLRSDIPLPEVPPPAAQATP